MTPSSVFRLDVPLCRSLPTPDDIQGHPQQLDSLVHRRLAAEATGHLVRPLAVREVARQMDSQFVPPPLRSGGCYSPWTPGAASPGTGFP